jgi:hypothetical protein
MADMQELLEAVQRTGKITVQHYQGFDVVYANDDQLAPVDGTTVKEGATGSIYVTHFSNREETWSAVFSETAPVHVVFNAVVSDR